jgi:two-component system cell cycle sensor histidine kinase/response regulator CckA
MTQPARISTPSPRRLLVIDDDQRTANRLASMLEEDGYVVEVLRDGRDALDRLEREPAPSGIITDLIMPRAGGIAILGEARRRWKDIPVVFVTGHPELLARPALPIDPAPLVLTKPISYGELSEALQRLFPI